MKEVWEDENAYYIPIKSIEIEYYKGYVYDLCIEDAHEFDVGFIVHNSFEIPLLESACCGTPSIVTNFSAPAEIVGYGERGLLVEPVGWLWMQLASARQAVVNPHDVAEALRTYYENPELRKRHVRKMMEWIEKNATWDIVARKWKKLIDEIDEYLKSLKVRK